MPLILRIHVAKKDFQRITYHLFQEKMTTIANDDLNALFKSLESKLLQVITTQLRQASKPSERANQDEYEDADWADATASTIAEEIIRLDIRNLLSNYPTVEKAVAIIQKVLTDEADFLYLQDFIDSIVSKREQRVKGFNYTYLSTYTYKCYFTRWVIYARS